MRTKSITLYQFSELPSEAAKENARQWLRECEGSDFDPEMEPVKTAAKLLGIELASRQRGTNRRTGAPIYEPAIGYCVSYCQRDGASYQGTYRHVISPVNILRRVRREFPTDKALHAMASGLAAIQRKYHYKLVVCVKEDRDSSHIDCVEMNDGSEADIKDEDYRALQDLLCYDFPRWIYQLVRAEYEYRVSDEALDETMEANQYEFTEDGERAA